MTLTLPGRTMAIAALLLASAGAALGETPLDALCRQYSGLDINADGEAEILGLRPLRPALDVKEGPLVAVLVEARLISQDADGQVWARLSRYAEDLAADGFSVWLVEAQVYAGPRHQDGQSLLALRRFLKAVRGAEPGLAGAVLVGAFPEAFLVRNYNWRRQDPIVLRKGQPDEQAYQAPYLRTVPEPVAMRCELILSDLDGRWEEAYIQPRTRLKTLLAVYPDGVPALGGPARDWEWGHVDYEDFFYANDGHFEVREILGPDGKVSGLDIKIRDDFENSECAAQDLERPNPMALPDLSISRINARGVALSPKKGLLDDQGRPKSLELEKGQGPKRMTEMWEFDPALERQLLIEYFDRNHRFRQGEFAAQWRPAAIACDLGNGFGEARKAQEAWAKADDQGERSSRATIADYVRWLRRPAVLRDIRAHSDPWGSEFHKVPAESLDAAIGGPIWAWHRRGDTLVNTLGGQGKADFPLYRTLWANGLPEGASFYYHNGCDGISPAGWDSKPYSDPGYGFAQGGESLLFYGQGLALVGRAKVFYDAPREFYETLAAGRTFGEAWRRYFELESAAEDHEQVGGGIGRKRAYFWSVLGDWTLRLKAGGA